MLPYAGTPEFFAQEEQRNAAPRRVFQPWLNVGQSIMLPQPLEPRSNHQQHGFFISNPIIRQGEPNIPTATCISGSVSSEHTLPGLRDVLMPDLRRSSRDLSSSSAHTSISSYEKSCDKAACHAPPGMQSPLASHSVHPPRNPRYADIHARLVRPLLRVSPEGTHHMDEGDHTEARHERSKRVSLSADKPICSAESYSPRTSNDQTPRTLNTSYQRSAHTQSIPFKPNASRRYLGIQITPQEGTFHIYEDGYRIPAQIDGERVNPQWGLTKANKPRKRLALACLNCRDKKTKCEPGAHGCLQCVKAKRNCRQ
jgi:hypothetical protein